MGDRISIEFREKGLKSVVLFAHWAGEDLLEAARAFPLDNYREPSHEPDPAEALVLFLFWLKETQPANMWANWGPFYLGHDRLDGDNSDQGHWIYDMETKQVREWKEGDD